MLSHAMGCGPFGSTPQTGSTGERSGTSVFRRLLRRAMLSNFTACSLAFNLTACSVDTFFCLQEYLL